MAKSSAGPWGIISPEDSLLEDFRRAGHGRDAVRLDRGLGSLNRDDRHLDTSRLRSDRMHEANLV